MSKKYYEMKKVGIYFITIMLGISANAQNLTQIMKGRVFDKESQISLPGANVIILSVNPVIGSVSDIDGNFRIENVPIGRYNIQISYIGYEPVTIPEILVGSGKEVVINIGLKESINHLDEVVVKAYTKKDRPLNSMATLSARTISVEESNRYAGGADDPARMVSAFAGVTTGDLDDNGIVVRGNAPKGMLWKLEGVEIPNPNHFANLSTFGGGGVTAFSSLLLTNSDFFTSAFPAEYGNAISGVFDFKFRNGNNEIREHAFQAGVLGIDFSSEGPFKKGSQSSYLFNYRYSTFGLIKHVLPEDANVPEYQDLCFKLNFPTSKTGIFSIWGIGAIDDLEMEKKIDSLEWETKEDLEHGYAKLNMGAVGVNHKIILGKKTYINSSISATANTVELEQNLLDSNINSHPNEFINSKIWNYSLASFVNHKFNNKHTNRTGFVIKNVNYDMNIKYSPQINVPLMQIVDDNEQSYIIQVYTQSNYYFTSKLSLNAGIHSQYFLLNNNYTIEPRIGLQYNLSAIQSISLAYGNHSQLEPLGLYLSQVTKNNQISQLNKDLELIRAHHLVLAYDRNITENVRLKIEPYVQFLYNVPVIPDSNYSTLNMAANWFINDELVNEGTGTNIGLDVTLERFLNNGYYYLMTASIFDSKYTGGDGISRNTRYNGNFVMNFLFGKEWLVGKNSKNNMLGINGRYNIFGGERMHPILRQESINNKEIIYDYSNAFEDQKPVVHHLNFSVSYRKNKENYTSIWSLQVLNLLGSKEYHSPDFNFKTNTIDEDAVRVIVPIISYKIEF